MSKSPNIFIPALGGTALVLGVAYGVTSRDYGKQHIESLQARVEQTESHIATASAKAKDLNAERDALLAERDALQAAVASGVGLTEPAPVAQAAFGLGRDALPTEIAAWDVDVLPDGRGLPAGSGDVWTGEEVFVEQCAACHGDFAEGVDNWPVLAGGFDTLADKDPVKTVGSYWPHLSTSWDYINRSMPFGNAGTLTADETYAIVAYILFSNDMVDDDFVLSQENFTDVEMHNAGGFIVDDRPETEHALMRAEPCMTDCKADVEVTMRAMVLDVTPSEEAEVEEATVAPAATQEAPAADAEVTTVAADPALIAAGEGAFRQCKSCHQVGDGAAHRTGPALNGIVGGPIGGADGFRYSNTFVAANEAGETWTPEALSAFLADPRGDMKGTKMAFAGVRKPEDIPALIAYLQSFAPE